jgi:hypothetical protein
MKHKSYLLIGIFIFFSITFAKEIRAKEEIKPDDQKGPAEEILSYEESMLNLLVPTNLRPLQVEFIVQHRFEGNVADKPFKNFFGADQGASVRLGLRFLIWSKLEINASHIFNEHEYEAGLSYALFFPKIFLKAQLDGQFLNYPYQKSETDPDNPLSGQLTQILAFQLNPLYALSLYSSSKPKIVNSYYFQFALRTYPIFGRVTPVVNVGYDGYNYKRVGLGTGLSIKIIDWLYVQGEFYPNFYKSGWKRDESGGLHCYAFGFLFQTPTHNFILMVGNNTQTGTRRLMMGTSTKSLHVGFNITKVF